MQFGTLLRSIQFLGLAGSLRALRYGVNRDLLDRTFRKARTKAKIEPRPPGPLQWAREIPHGVELKFEQAALELLLLAPDVLRITWKPGDLPIPYSIVGNDWPGDQARLEEASDEVRLLGSQLLTTISSEGVLRINDLDGLCLRADDAPLLSGESWAQTSPLAPQASIYGLGERASGWNLRGGNYTLWNQDPGGSYGPGHDPLYMSVPVYLCLQPTGHYLLYYENAHRGEIALHDDARVCFERGALRSYFIHGTPDHVLDRYSQLTGRPPLPPRWSLGYHQSRWGYRDQQEIQAIADQFKQHKLPISVIHLDIDYMQDFRVFTFDPEYFSDVKSLARSLQEEDIKLVAIVDPGVKVDRGYSVYQEGMRDRSFCTLPNGKPMLSVVWPGWVHFPDFTDPAARDWWGAYYPRLLDQGIAGIWHDMNEPTAFTPWGDKTFPLLTQHSFEAQGGDHLGAHNLYALLMNRAGYEALQKARPESRPWLLSRAGFAGGQRYAWNWTGDVETSWEALRQTLATMMGVGVSGFPFTGSDVGGFSGEPDRELYLRWFQLGAFSPFFRTHSAIGTAAREPWNFDEEIVDAVRKCLQARYRLMPYLYTLAWFASQRGTPLLRPTFWTNPDSPDLWQIADQYFLGPDLLVAPVLDAGLQERQVLFPAGRWYGFWDESDLRGEATQSVPADLTHIPVFVRGGAILPLEISPHEIELHVYLPEAGEMRGLLYSDDGDGYGEFRVDHFNGTRQGDTLYLNRTNEGEFDWPYGSLRLVVHGAEMEALIVDGQRSDQHGKRAALSLFNEVAIKLI